MLIEPRTAALAAINGTPEQIEALADLSDKIIHLHEQGEDYQRSDAAFHTMLGTMSGNLIMPSLEPILLSSITLSNKVGKDTDRTITVRFHQDIVQAVREHNPVGAEDAMLLHLAYCRNILNQR